MTPFNSRFPLDAVPYDYDMMVSSNLGGKMADNKALYRRWRPQTFADLVGQEHIKQTILNAIKAGYVSHAYLFAGPRGTGKTSLARLLAKAVNCLDIQAGEPCGKCANCVALSTGRMMDLIEIDAASNTSVDDMRSLIEKVNFAPSVGKYKVYIIDEAHMLSKNAFNALLKTLEEPPAHAIFILATTEVHKFPATIISRCQYFDFHYLKHSEVAEQLKKIATQEGVEIDDTALKIIADNAEGSLRDAISMLDQAVSFSSGKVDQEVLKNLLGIVDILVIRQITQAIIDKDVTTGIGLINEIYFKGYDLHQLGKLWLNYLRELLMIKLGNENLVQKSTDEVTQMRKQAEGFSVNELINLLQRVVESLNQYQVASLPQLALEMVMAKSCAVVSSNNPVISVALPTKPQENPVALEKKEDTNIPVTQVAPSIDIKTADLPTIHAQLCENISKVSPSLGAVMKNSRIDIQPDKVCLTVPSKFLQDTLNKLANRDLINGQLIKMGITGATLEIVVDKTSDSMAVASGVFDIM